MAGRYIQDPHPGGSVSERGTYVARLTQLLKDEYGDDNIDVLNVGAAGYDTAMQQKFLMKYGWQYDPDLVLLQFNVNDFDGTPVIIPDED